MKIVTIIGARPQFIKASMVSKELRKKHEEIFVHTGQHYDKNMSEIFFQTMGIPKPNYNLNIGSGSHSYQTGNMMIQIESILLKENPNCVVVYGDTNSTLAGALAASKLLIPVVHIEAGLRSYNKDMPEEQNRVLTDHISDILFCPSKTSVKNLKKENITKNVFDVGDVMCDSTLYYSQILGNNLNINDLELQFINKKRSIKNWYLLTIHRAENTKNSKILKEILSVMEDLDYIVIFPVHPRVREIVDLLEKENNYKNIVFIEPVDYLTMIFLTKNSKKVITDSGGLQKECYILNTPCITVRDQTEWIETLNQGYNILTKPIYEELKSKIEKAEIKVNKKINYFGDGKASAKIVKIMEEIL